VIGMMVVALLLGAVLTPVVSAQSAPGSYAGVAGNWAGYVTWPGGGSSETIWTINPDGTFSLQTDLYTAVGSLKSLGAAYAFSYERDGQTYTGTLAAQASNGRSRLVGSGEAPNGAMDITLTR
jgi:hypothetical protein